MEIAIATDEKQLVGRDANGQDIYVEPPSRSQYNACGYSPYGYGGYGYGCCGYGGYGLGLGLDALLLGGLFLCWDVSCRWRSTYACILSWDSEALFLGNDYVSFEHRFRFVFGSNH
jgi:hypothetical protein